MDLKNGRKANLFMFDQILWNSDFSYLIVKDQCGIIFSHKKNTYQNGIVTNSYVFERTKTN